jgi:thiamine-phosphate pyrophosphorylase
VSGTPGLADRLTLTVITDPSAPQGVERAAEAALAAGATTVQLRWKTASTRELLGLARDLRIVTREAGALLIINDRVDVALATDADGAHLGDDDLPLEVARRIVPVEFVLGRSVDTIEEASAAVAGGADYVGLGPVYATDTKRDTGPVLGLAGVAAVRARVSLPIVAIGGIRPGTAAGVIRAGADGIAVVGAVMSAADPYGATASILREIATAKPVGSSRSR